MLLTSLLDPLRRGKERALVHDVALFLLLAGVTLLPLVSSLQTRLALFACIIVLRGLLSVTIPKTLSNAEFAGQCAWSLAVVLLLYSLGCWWGLFPAYSGAHRILQLTLVNVLLLMVYLDKPLLRQRNALSRAFAFLLVLLALSLGSCHPRSQGQVDVLDLSLRLSLCSVLLADFW
jgi:hypothetical protein